LIAALDGIVCNVCLVGSYDYKHMVEQDFTVNIQLNPPDEGGIEMHPSDEKITSARHRSKEVVHPVTQNPSIKASADSAKGNDADAVVGNGNDFDEVADE
jgi:hypothetical protein